MTFRTFGSLSFDNMEVVRVNFDKTFKVANLLLLSIGEYFYSESIELVS